MYVKINLWKINYYERSVLNDIFGFRGGVHPPENKIQTEHLPIEKLESPDEIFVPLLQHIGAPLNPLVNVGDRVLKGQKLQMQKV